MAKKKADLRGAIEIASRYYGPEKPAERTVKKDSIGKKIGMAALGPLYKNVSKQGRKMKKMRKKFERQPRPSLRTTHLKRQAQERYGTQI